MLKFRIDNNVPFSSQREFRELHLLFFPEGIDSDIDDIVLTVPRCTPGKHNADRARVWSAVAVPCCLIVYGDLNNSWNCGVEGDSDDPEVLALRNRLRKNAFASAQRFHEGKLPT